ncbi:hypothetical protein [Deinococcus sp. QL22]|uniref:hypothetical protein n=1 Tax=Deinococcus sp. QL22 TaxID=2939437 RepID=UPI0020181FC5|nr:hypothetical protein [Deinococcus sp. QL22]UQN10844.1 hypothetical protein M1R55_31625 [Deinococcus sp. QL22]
MARLTPEQLSTERYTEILNCLSRYGPAPRTLLSKHYGVRPITRLIDEGFLRTTRTVLGTVVTYRQSHSTLELAGDLSQSTWRPWAIDGPNALTDHAYLHLFVDHLLDERWSFNTYEYRKGNAALTGRAHQDCGKFAYVGRPTPRRHWEHWQAVNQTRRQQGLPPRFQGPGSPTWGQCHAVATYSGGGLTVARLHQLLKERQALWSAHPGKQLSAYETGSSLLIAAPDLTPLQGALAAIRRQDELQYQKHLARHREMPRDFPDPPVLIYRVEAYALPVSRRAR